MSDYGPDGSTNTTLKIPDALVVEGADVSHIPHPELLSLLPMFLEIGDVKTIGTSYSRTNFTFGSDESKQDDANSPKVTGQIKVTGETSTPDQRVEVRVKFNFDQISELVRLEVDQEQARQKLAAIGSTYISLLYSTIKHACGKAKDAQIFLQLGSEHEIKLGKYGEQLFDLDDKEAIFTASANIFESKINSKDIDINRTPTDAFSGTPDLETGVAEIIDKLVPKGVTKKTAFRMKAGLALTRATTIPFGSPVIRTPKPKDLEVTGKPKPEEIKKRAFEV